MLSSESRYAFARFLLDLKIIKESEAKKLYSDLAFLQHILTLYKSQRHLGESKERLKDLQNRLEKLRAEVV